MCVMNNAFTETDILNQPQNLMDKYSNYWGVTPCSLVAEEKEYYVFCHYFHFQDVDIINHGCSSCYVICLILLL
jgi:hypothetical protein